MNFLNADLKIIIVVVCVVALAEFRTSLRPSVVRRKSAGAIMKRARGGVSAADARRVVIDVGGTRLSTTYGTIRRSAYLSGLVDVDALGAEPEGAAELFLDRDPEIFAHTLRLMRQFPHVAGLLPSEPRACASLIAEADFLGLEPLLDHVRVRAYYNARHEKEDQPPRPIYSEVVAAAAAASAEPLTNADRKEAWQRATREYGDVCEGVREKHARKDEAFALGRFGEVFGTIAEALSAGVLPHFYLELAKPKPKPYVRILQLMPTDATTWLLVGDVCDQAAQAEPLSEDIYAGEMKPMARVVERPGFVRRVAMYALVENEHDERWVEPMLHITPQDQEEFLCEEEPGLRLAYQFMNDATLEHVLKHGNSQRTMLARDWMRHAVHERICLSDIPAGRYWTHLLVTEEPPEEHGFSHAHFIA
jgi:hypothetical protein